MHLPSVLYTSARRQSYGSLISDLIISLQTPRADKHANIRRSAVVCRHELYDHAAHHRRFPSFYIRRTRHSYSSTIYLYLVWAKGLCIRNTKHPLRTALLLQVTSTYQVHKLHTCVRMSCPYHLFIPVIYHTTAVLHWNGETKGGRDWSRAGLPRDDRLQVLVAARKGAVYLLIIHTHTWRGRTQWAAPMRTQRARGREPTVGIVRKWSYNSIIF